MASALGGLIGGLGGGAIGRAAVTLALDTSAYDAQLAAAEGKTAAATSSMSGETAAAGGAMTAAYAAAGVAAGAFVISAIQSAAEHEQVLAALQAQVGSNTQAYEDQADALQNLTGFQDEAVLSADTILARFKLTDAQVRASIPAVLDYARATGKTAPEAASVLGKALLGSSKALKAIGISSEQAAAAAGDFPKLLELINNQVGGQAAAYAETYAGKLEILSAKFDDLKESVGGPLIDEIAQLADSLSTTLSIVERVGDVLPEMGEGFNLIKGALAPLTVLTEYNNKVLGWAADLIGADTEATDEKAAADISAADAQQMAADATTTATEAARQHAQALRDEKAAEQELAGGLTGLIADMNSLNDAQGEVNELRKEGKKHTQEYRDAELQALEAQRSFNGDLADMAQKMRENDVPLKNIIDRIYGIGHQAGLSRKDIRDLIDDTKGLGDALDTLQDRTIKIHIDRSDVYNAEEAIRGLQGKLAAIGGP